MGCSPLFTRRRPIGSYYAHKSIMSVSPTKLLDQHLREDGDEAIKLNYNAVLVLMLMLLPGATCFVSNIISSPLASNLHLSKSTIQKIQVDVQSSSHTDIPEMS